MATIKAHTLIKGVDTIDISYHKGDHVMVNVGGAKALIDVRDLVKAAVEANEGWFARMACPKCERIRGTYGEPCIVCP